MQTNKNKVVKASRKTVEKISALIIAVALLCAGTAFATTPPDFAVDVYDGANITRVVTHKMNPNEILNQADVILNENDKLDLSEYVTGADSRIIVRRAADVTFVNAEGESQSVNCAGTVSDLLAAVNVTVQEGQILNLAEDTILENGQTVKVLDLCEIHVSADGQEQVLKMAAGTVQDALQEANLSLQNDDEVQPALDTPISDQLNVKVSRVTYQERTEEEKISFKKETKNDSKKLVGTSEIIQNGKNGKKQVVYRDKYVDGVLTSSSSISEKVIEPAVSQITVKGTMKKNLSRSKLKNGGHPISELTPPSDLQIVDGAPTSYSKIIRGKAAAYSAKPTAKTASGRQVKPGYIAVNPAQIPYGTEMWIVSTDGIVYGYAIAADTGGFIHQGKFTVDLFMSSNAECRQWGARDVIIYVL